MKKKMLEKLEAKMQEAFDLMCEDFSDEAVTKYEGLVRQVNNLREEIALEEKSKSKPPENLTSGQVGLDETRKFFSGLVEAVAKGSTFTGVLPREVSQTIIKKAETLSKLGQHVTRHPVSGDYTIYVSGDDCTVDYVAEGAAIGETDPSIVPISLGALKLAGLVKVSREYLSDLGVNVQAYVEERLALAFARKEDHEILLGAGTTKMEGIVTKCTDQVLSTATAATLAFDDVLTLINSLGDYQYAAHLMMNQSVVNSIAMMKDAKGQYLFPPNAKLTEIRGIPIIPCKDLPGTLAGGTVAIVAGDLSYYHIADREGIEMVTLNERYADTDQIGIRAIRRVDGKVALTEAFKILKVKASS